MNKSILLLLSGSLTGLGNTYSNECNIKSKPNIVIFQVDDLGWTDLTCFGSKFYETPNIDKLAANGMKFTNAYAPCAVCSPSRAAILTGRYPARIGVTDWIRASFQIPATLDKSNLPEYELVQGKSLQTPLNPFEMKLSEVTIAEMLKPHGYVTCHIGKWHLGDQGFYPENQGFDINIAGCDFGEPPTFFDPYIRPANPDWKEPEFSFPNLKPRKAGEYLTDREADEAVKFIREHANSPFFLYYSPYAVHLPLQAKEHMVKKYRNKPAGLQKNPKYAAMIESLDEALGRLVNTLTETGLLENTVLIFTSDNGGLKGITNNSPLRAGKGFPYEGGIRVPFIVHWPSNVKGGSVNETPVQNTDLFPTIAMIAGIPLPNHPIDGKSILPLIQQKGKFSNRALFWHFPHYRNNDTGPYSIVRKGDFKMIRFYDPRKDVLYHLKNDPSETTDISGSYPKVLKDLQKEMDQLIESTGAKLPKVN